MVTADLLPLEILYDKDETAWLEAMAVLNGEGLQAGSRSFEERDFAVPAIDKLIARFDDSDSETGEDRP